MMSAHEVAKYLIETCESLREYKSFMFGSSLRGIGSDFDILIVGPGGQPLVQLKAELRIAGMELPLDVLYMLPAEAEATQFVVKEGCVALAKLAFCNAARDSGLGVHAEQNP